MTVRRHRARAAKTLLVAGLLTAYGAMSGAAAATPPGVHRPVTTPPAPAAPTAAALPPDTARVVLDFPAENVLVGTEPDSLFLGDVLRMVFSGPTLPDSLGLPPFLEAEQVSFSDEGAVLAVRAYRLGPLQVTAGGVTSPVVVVRGRLADLSATAPVRMPRGLGWNTVFLAFLVLVVVAFLVVAGWLTRRRWGHDVLGRHRELPVAVWPGSAGDLLALVDGPLAAGDERGFLDDFSSLVRSYVARRFLVSGREMTSLEIAAACRRLGYEAAVAVPFARLVEDVDRRRYDPAPVSEAWCREQVARFLLAVEGVKIRPQPGSLRPGELTAGEDAWRRLKIEVAESDLERGA